MNEDQTTSEDTKFLRLVTGDDVIGEVLFKNKNTFTLKNPMRVIIDADLDMGRQTIYMHNWLPQGVSLGNSCELSTKNILFISEVEPDILDYYNGVVFEMLEDRGKFKRVEKQINKKDPNEENSKVITFPGSKNNIE